MKESEMDQTLPLVSVIMPTYNHAAFIKESIESALSQSYEHLELIVIDNFSTDDTEQIVKSFINVDERIRYLAFRNHGIIAASRNFGIANSKGEFIAFLDSDDMWHPSKIEKQLAFFPDEGIVGVGTDATFISGTPHYRQIYYGRGQGGYIDYDYQHILRDNPIRTSSVLVRRDALLAVDGFDENPDFRFIEDWELWLRMAQGGSFRILEDRFLFYRVFTDKNRDMAESARRCFKVLERHLDLGYVNAEDTREATASINHSIARGLLRGDNPKCRQYFLKAIRGSSLHSKRLRALIGYLVSLLPPVFRQPTLSVLYAADKICRALRDLI